VKRLYCLVEGWTEEAFVKNTLAPHLEAFNLWAKPIVVGGERKNRDSSPIPRGGGSWERWRRDFQRLLGEQHGHSVHFTTLFDLFRLPLGFPGLEEWGGVQDGVERCRRLEQSLLRDIDDHRLIPYLQVHEFEALVLASLPALRDWLDSEEDLEGLDRLIREVGGSRPEEVNDGPTTAPSKRILASIPGYQKTLHGPYAIGDTGLDAVRQQCPRFDSWISMLENL